MTDNLRAKFAGLESEPMFDAPKRRSQPAVAKPLRAISQKTCPECQKRVGVYVKATRNSSALVYRRHWRVTNSGAGFLCSNSDQPLQED